MNMIVAITLGQFLSILGAIVVLIGMVILYFMWESARRSA